MSNFIISRKEKQSKPKWYLKLVNKSKLSTRKCTAYEYRTETAEESMKIYNSLAISISTHLVYLKMPNLPLIF